MDAEALADKGNKKGKKVVDLVLLIMLMAAAFIVGVSMKCAPEESEMTCLSAMLEVESMRSCLSVRPACDIPDGVEAFRLYHEAGAFLVAHCGLGDNE